MADNFSDLLKKLENLKTLTEDLHLDNLETDKNLFKNSENSKKTKKTLDIIIKMKSISSLIQFVIDDIDKLPKPVVVEQNNNSSTEDLEEAPEEANTSQPQSPVEAQTPPEAVVAVVPVPGGFRRLRKSKSKSKCRSYNKKRRTHKR